MSEMLETFQNRILLAFEVWDLPISRHLCPQLRILCMGLGVSLELGCWGLEFPAGAVSGSICPQTLPLKTSAPRTTIHPKNEASLSTHQSNNPIIR
jgi:hypothetical protein